MQLGYIFIMDYPVGLLFFELIDCLVYKMSNTSEKSPSKIPYIACFVCLTVQNPPKFH